MGRRGSFPRPLVEMQNGLATILNPVNVALVVLDAVGSIMRGFASLTYSRVVEGCAIDYCTGDGKASTNEHEGLAFQV